MNKKQLSEYDFELIKAAQDCADRLYCQGLHEVAAAIRTKSGKVYTGIHIETQIDWADVCGEVAAMCCMVADGHRDLDTVVAIWKSPEGKYFLLSPCGRCRELIYDFNKKANVITGSLEEPFIVTIKDLLPLRTWENDDE